MSGGHHKLRGELRNLQINLPASITAHREGLVCRSREPPRNALERPSSFCLFICNSPGEASSTNAHTHIHANTCSRSRKAHEGAVERPREREQAAELENKLQHHQISNNLSSCMWWWQRRGGGEGYRVSGRLASEKGGRKSRGTISSSETDERLPSRERRAGSATNRSR
jgi:hypothetical protein